MERLTIDEAIKHAREVAENKYAEGMLCHANPNDDLLDGCIKCAEEHVQLAEWLEKLKAYEQAEEDGLLKMLPVAIGSDVYFIPSKKNYDLNALCNLKENNRVYHQKVERIIFTDRGWYVECDKDCEYGTGRVLVDIFYKETWFTTESEAKQALAKMKGE